MRFISEIGVGLLEWVYKCNFVRHIIINLINDCVIFDRLWDNNKIMYLDDILYKIEYNGYWEVSKLQNSQ